MSRQQVRRYRLLELEKEQHLDDAQGLVLTEEQRQSLLHPFASVKVEFHDLDGLRWTQTALRRRQHHFHCPSVLSQTRPDYSFLVLNNPQFTDNHLEATVRYSASPNSHQLHPSNQRASRNPSVISPSFWHADSNIDEFLGFPAPPSTIPTLPSARTYRTFVGGLGFVSPAIETIGGHYTPTSREPAVVFDSVIYSTPYPIRS